MKKIRFKDSFAGPSSDYTAGDVRDIDDANADRFIAGRYAVPEGPAPSGVVAAAYRTAGYTEVVPLPSGMRIISTGEVIADAPSGGAFTCLDSYTLRVFFPGSNQATFDLLKLRP